MSTRTCFHKLVYYLVMAMTFTWIPFTDAYGCPMCKYGLISVLNPDYVSGLAKGYYWSIILMLGVPITLLTVMISLIVKSKKKNLY